MTYEPDADTYRDLLVRYIQYVRKTKETDFWNDQRYPHNQWMTDSEWNQLQQLYERVSKVRIHVS